MQAGAEAARVFDFETALAHYERALQLGLEPSEAYDVRDRRLLLLHRLYRTDEQLRELTLMAELARATDNPAAPFELAAKRAVTLFNSGRIADALAHARWVAEGAPTRTLVTRPTTSPGSRCSSSPTTPPREPSSRPRWPMHPQSCPTACR